MSQFEVAVTNSFAGSADVSLETVIKPMVIEIRIPRLWQGRRAGGQWRVPHLAAMELEGVVLEEI
jgi:hypothetical protein